MKRVSYEGKKVYVGIDVHKKTYTTSAWCEGAIVRTLTTPADRKNFPGHLKKWFPGADIFTAYEAGFSGFGLHRTLEKEGIKSIVINPSSLEVSAKEKVKTDKKDSKKIATQLATGRFRGIRIPTEKEERARLITRTREQVMKDRSRNAHRIKSLLHYFGLMDMGEAKSVSEDFLKEYESMDLPEEVAFSLKTLAEKWRSENKLIEEIAVEMKGQSFEDSRNEAIYQSVPGVGDISARTFSNELGDLAKRFNSNKALCQFVGLTPTEYSSGENQRLGHIDRQGPARVRKALIECAWRAIATDTALEEAFGKLAHRRGKKRAIVAIARKMLGRMRACFVNEEEYCKGFAT